MMRLLIMMWYEIALYLQLQTNSKSYKFYYDLSSGTIFNDLELPSFSPDLKVIPLFDVKYLRNGTRYIVSVEY